MCNCLSKTENDVQKKIVEKEKERGRNILSMDSESGFTCKGLSFTQGEWIFILPMEFKYTVEKKDGAEDKRPKKYKTNMLPVFCPMCGEKIQYKP